MRTKTYHASVIESFLRKKKIATMAELKAAMRSNVDMTVFRKLRELTYRTSYSHRGRYYTLDEIAHFDNQGLWSFESVWFSRYGTLLETVKNFVFKSKRGYTARELKDILYVDVKESLLRLFNQKCLYREKVSGVYVYFSGDSDSVTPQSQIMFRRKQDAQDRLDNELKAAIILFFSLLDEKQRRLYAGLESIKLGHGGDKKIAELLGIDPYTVSKGRRELLNQNSEPGRIRKKGGGREPMEKKRQKL